MNKHYKPRIDLEHYELVLKAICKLLQIREDLDHNESTFNTINKPRKRRPGTTILSTT